MNDGDIDAGLLRALHHFLNAEVRWEERQRRGLTDKELAEAIRYEFEERAAGTLNWFENGQLMIGSKHDPNHVNAWRKWNQEIGVEVEVHEP